jgi:surface protein
MCAAWKDLSSCTVIVNEPALRLDTVDTSAVTSMRFLFRFSTFNGDLRSWDTAQVTNMAGMFQDASDFDQPLPAWDTGRVTTMSGMFAGATRFNKILPAWDTANVTDMSYMLSSSRTN